MCVCVCVRQGGGGCHNPIFYRGIFSDVGTQNETVRTKSAWSDEGLSHQITSEHGLGHISQNLGSFDQGWPSVDQGLTEPFLIRIGSTMPRNPRNVVRDTFLRVWKVLTKFDQVWPMLTKVWPDRWPDQKLNRTDRSSTILKSMMRASIQRFTGQKWMRNEGVMVKTVKKRSNT